MLFDWETMQSHFNTSHFDTNSSSEIAQKFVHFKSSLHENIFYSLSQVCGAIYTLIEKTCIKKPLLTVDCHLTYMY